MMMNRKKWNRLVRGMSKSKTIIFSFILSMFGVLQMQLDQIRVLIDDPKDFAVFCLFVSTIIGILRFITTTSIMEKASDDGSEGNVDESRQNK